MTVRLITYTPDALDILLMTKQTRLDFNPELLEEIRQWPMEKKLQELAYMRGTIQSSWEFVDYTFLLTGVSRAFTHQFVRTRQGSYAQQSQRTVDMSGFEYLVPDQLREEDLGEDDPPLTRTSEYGIDFLDLDETVGSTPDLSSGRNWYDWGMLASEHAYSKMREKGVNPQDARGVLPTNIATNIVAKFSLRTLSDMAKIRLCTRTQGEYQNIFREMRQKVIEVHPWAEQFIEVHCVALGVCAFPNYMECPIKGPLLNPETGLRWDNGVTKRTLRIEPNPSNGLKEPIHHVMEYPAHPAPRWWVKQKWEELRYEAVPRQHGK